MADELYIGLMSGTSMDAIDCVLVDFSSSMPKSISSLNYPIPEKLHQKITALLTPGDNEVQRVAQTDIELGQLFSQAVLQLLKESQINSGQVIAIGSHGQNIRHCPQSTPAYTVQIADPHGIAELTGITTVADFRKRDLVRGGQGAPLTPLFHQKFFHSEKQTRILINIGGIANVTVLPKLKTRHVVGFDSGPGNTLLDVWHRQHQQQDYDENGAWAASGQINQPLLKRMLADAYFSKPAPKSTGREYFNLNWLKEKIQQSGDNIAAEDVQATLAELTAQTIYSSLENHLDADCEILVYGGGLHNQYLISRIEALTAAHNLKLESTEKHGIDPDFLEAICFAWLAKQTLQKKKNPLPQVTGAQQGTLLGAVYY